jgi:hypothetical protein
MLPSPSGLTSSERPSLPLHGVNICPRHVHPMTLFTFTTSPYHYQTLSSHFFLHLLITNAYTQRSVMLITQHIVGTQQRFAELMNSCTSQSVHSLYLLCSLSLSAWELEIPPRNEVLTLQSRNQDRSRLQSSPRASSTLTRGWLTSSSVGCHLFPGQKLQEDWGCLLCSPPHGQCLPAVDVFVEWIIG